MKMQTLALVLLCAAFAGAGCIVPGPHGRPVLLVPPLPPVVELGPESYYAHGGYHYHYRNHVWFYSQEPDGPWSELPRDHYPREMRFRPAPPGPDRPGPGPGPGPHP